jgi:hypothetical protein
MKDDTDTLAEYLVGHEVLLSAGHGDELIEWEFSIKTREQIAFAIIEIMIGSRYNRAERDRTEIDFVNGDNHFCLVLKERDNPEEVEYATLIQIHYRGVIK